MSVQIRIIKSFLLLPTVLLFAASCSNELNDSGMGMREPVLEHKELAADKSNSIAQNYLDVKGDKLDSSSFQFSIPLKITLLQAKGPALELGVEEDDSKLNLTAASNQSDKLELLCDNDAQLKAKVLVKIQSLSSSKSESAVLEHKCKGALLVKVKNLKAPEQYSLNIYALNDRDEVIFSGERKLSPNGDGSDASLKLNRAK